METIIKIIQVGATFFRDGLLILELAGSHRITCICALPWKSGTETRKKYSTNSQNT
jgi:hypothetical protein